MADDGNNHNESNAPWVDRAKDKLARSPAEALISSKEAINAISKLVDPGGSLVEIIMRAYFENPTQMTALVHHYSKCEEFEDEQGKREAIYEIAGLVSVGGRSRHELVQAICGDAQLKQQRAGSAIGNWLRKTAGNNGGGDSDGD